MVGLIKKIKEFYFPVMSQSLVKAINDSQRGFWA